MESHCVSGSDWVESHCVTGSDWVESCVSGNDWVESCVSGSDLLCFSVSQAVFRASSIMSFSVIGPSIIISQAFIESSVVVS